MAIGPWDPTNAATPGQAHFLASDADRERAVEMLKAAYVYGALTRDELTARTARALTARTYADLAASTGGVGAPGRPQHRTPSRRKRARKRVNKKVVAWSTVAVVLPAALGVSFLTFYGGFLVMMLLFFAGAVLCSKPPAPPQVPLAKSIGGKH